MKTTQDELDDDVIRTRVQRREQEDVGLHVDIRSDLQRFVTNVEPSTSCNERMNLNKAAT